MITVGGILEDSSAVEDIGKSGDSKIPADESAGKTEADVLTVILVENKSPTSDRIKEKETRLFGVDCDRFSRR